MQYILLSALLAFLITYFAIPVVIQIAKSKKLYDEPDERKVHKVVIPTLGGVGIFAGFIMAVLMCVPDTALDVGNLKSYVAAAVVIFFLGLKDDILVLSANKKFIGQLVAAVIIMRFGNIYLNNLHGFLGIHSIPYIASVVLTIFTIIVITNSFNLIDGVDGLAGSLGLITSLAFGTYFYFASTNGSYIVYSVMALSLVGATLGFLIYNYSPAKIFMGDTGSLLLGLINSVLVIKFIAAASLPTNPIAVNAAPALGFAVLMVPLFDTLRVFGLRILDRRSPFSADRIHVHHYLLDLGFSHKKITLSCVAATIVFIVAALLLQRFGTTLVVIALLTLAFTFIGIIYYSRKKIKQAYKVEFENKDIRTSSKIISFAKDVVQVN